MHVDDIPNFRTFFENHLISESPYIIGKEYGQNLNNIGFNYKTGQLIVSKGEDGFDNFNDIKLIDSVLFQSLKEELYRKMNFDTVQDWWLEDQSHYVHGHFRYVVINNEMRSEYAWSYRGVASGFARWLFKKYYLKHYSAIISDIAHTPEGSKFWINLINDCKGNHKITILIGKTVEESKEEQIDFKDLNQYWDKDNKSLSRIKIYA